MADVEKTLKGLECCHKMGVLGLPSCDELECPYFKDRLSCWLDVLSDAIELMKEYEVLKDQNAKLIRQKQERFQPVRCKDCCNWKPPHILLNDGRQRLYRDGEKNDPLHIGVSMDVGINIGGKCWVDHNCGYGRDMRVFRKEDDYCSRAIKLPEGTTAEQYWGLSEEPAELMDD